MAEKTNTIFRLALPPDWQDTSVFTFQGPHDNGLQHNIVLTVDRYSAKKTALEEYARMQFGNTKSMLPGFELIGEGEKELTNGRRVYEITYKYIPADNVILFQKQTFYIIAQTGYIFTATFTKKTMKTIANTVDTIIASFVPFEVEEDAEHE